MSKKNNVNPDHYKIAGRDRQGEDVLQEVHKQKYAQAKSRKARAGQGKGEPASLPGLSPLGLSGGKTGQTKK